MIVLVYGLGGQYKDIWDVLGAWVKSGHMVFAKSQCVFGEADLNKYAVGRQAEERGILSASTMSLEACFAKLSYMLGNSINDQAFFHQNVVGELTESLRARSSSYPYFMLKIKN